jgi:hypothetical protein
MNESKKALVRALNDRLRVSGLGGRRYITRGVAALGSAFVLEALVSVAGADKFDDDNDPHQEHDFGGVVVREIELLWKIDYYDSTLSMGAEDPSDSAECVRVLTLMLSDEY